MKKVILTVVLTLSVIAGIVLWLINSEEAFDFQEFLMLAGLAIIILFAIILAYKRYKSAREDLPVEDELSKKQMNRAAATAYYVSIYFWLALMYFEGEINLERSTLIGGGILGMAVIFVLSWLYHRFVRRRYE